MRPRLVCENAPTEGEGQKQGQLFEEPVWL